MLVLTRREDEAITIGDSIVITVLSVDGDRVKLGIAAPREMPIMRGEIYQAIKAQDQLAIQLAKSSEEPDTFLALRQFLAKGE
jgi:carbon storage regulator